MEFAFLFNSSDLADCQVTFKTSAPANRAGSLCPAKRQREDESEEGEASDGLSFPAHSAVLAARSEVFKASLLNWANCADKQSNAEGRKVLVQYVEAGELPAAKFVLQSIYEVCLPHELQQAASDPETSSDAAAAAPAATAASISKEDGQECSRVERLLQMYRLAHRLQAPACTKLCIEALESVRTQELDVSSINAVHALMQLAPLLYEDAAMQPLLKACTSRLIHLFGDVGTTLCSSKLRARFLNLGHAAVVSLAASDEVMVASENDMLTLLSIWVDNHSQGCSEAELVELSNQLRLLHLTPVFFSKCTKLAPWLRLPEDVLATATLLRTSARQEALLQLLVETEFKQGLPAAFASSGRKAAGVGVYCFRWQLSRAELADMFKQAREAGPGAEGSCTTSATSYLGCGK